MLHLWLGVTPADAAHPPPGGHWPPARGAALFDARIRERRYVVYAWPPDAASRALGATPSAVEVRLGPLSPHAAAARIVSTRLEIDRRTGALTVTMPATCTAPLFHAGDQSGALWLASDPRWLPVRQRHLDPRGLYALLQFGAIPAPYTLWKAVRRLAPGSRTRFAWLDDARRAPRTTTWSAPLPASATRPHDLPEGARVGYVGERLDAVLTALCPDRAPVLLFSGGVDSGLLAARCARLGWRETLLLCYRMDDTDPQPQWAAEMARRLGLSLRIVPARAPDWARMLTSLSSDYPEPVGDFGVPAAYDLMRQLERIAGGRCTVLDGSGADALFRTFPALGRWRRLYRLPPPLRCAAGGLWRAMEGWHRTARVVRWLGAARISCSLPYELGAMVAENALAGIAYSASQDARRAVETAFRSALQLALPALPDALAPRALDLLHVVCALTAQKNAPLVRGSKLDLIHPFLHPDLVGAGLAWGRDGGRPRVSKAILKQLLARDLPGALIERPKRGMTPEMRTMLRDPGVGRWYQRAFETAPGDLAGRIDLPRLQRMLQRAVAGAALPHGSYNLLWTAAITARWLADARHAGDVA
ncbi:MAG: hypothetical protein GF330_02505 [Candidatus Eisenbacteria bacterium]|nr:hypothetical protein [Candidatus Eisenbacteria bacterium]